MSDFNDRRPQYTRASGDTDVPLDRNTLRSTNQRLRQTPHVLPWQREARSAAVDRGIRSARKARTKDPVDNLGDYLDLVNDQINKTMNRDKQRR